MAPDVEPYDQDVISKEFVQVIEQVGKAVLIIHSQGAGLGWQSASDNSNKCAGGRMSSTKQWFRVS